jgi:two-component system cell cycle sensor histidine kinase/response regulator CckA
MTAETKTVLVVDENKDLRQLVAIALSKSGFRVLQARDCIEALMQIDSFGVAIDVLLLDVVMPRLYGIELARVMQSIHPKIRIIFMSGHPADIIKNHGIFEGNIRFINNPFTPDTLVKIIREELNR